MTKLNSLEKIWYNPKRRCKMDIKDPNEELAKVVMDVYHYALKNNLDIRSRTDVVKILKVVDPDNFRENRVELVMAMLPVTDAIIKKDLARRVKIN